MKTKVEHPVVVLGCGVFKAEILALKEQHWPDIDLRFLNSMLHMAPDKLGRCLDGLVKKEGSLEHKILLIYGDCCSQMGTITKNPDVVRVRGNNCCDLLLGRQMYRRLSHEGAFFLFPEWASRWRHIFRVELGLNEANGASLMKDMHKKLVYLNTGVLPVPVDDLEACAQYCQLPWEVLEVSLESLRTCIQTGLDQLKK